MVWSSNWILCTFICLNCIYHPAVGAKCSLKPLRALCIAQCLNLTEAATEAERCRFYPRTGFAIENRMVQNCEECVDPEIWKKSPRIIQMKYIDKAVKTRIKFMCRKYIYLGPVVPAEAGFVLVNCQYSKKDFNVWSPRSLEEINCVLTNMPQEYRDAGKLRLGVVRRNCSEEFVFCDPLGPRALGRDFLRVTPSKKKIKPEPPFFGSCTTLQYQFRNGALHKVELLESACSEPVAYLCEYEGDFSDAFASDRLVN